MRTMNQGFVSLEQVQDRFLNQNTRQSGKAGDAKVSFEEYLSKAESTKKNAEEVKFSKHAMGRLSIRNIELTKEQLGRLSEGTRKAEEKGINDSLMLMDSLAFIVNVPTGTVVTAMDQSETKDKIFTNIDGAVII